ncbi:hypothetical protein QEZ54_07230 [Catellatospora sp. KI3]|uniref:hypothetical protein n=1 Tax=Catellatospora sp. KI3 TaxID=3041620 RepID=UPI0024821D4C|nr:hypothetical protein [Catellatospora sp. KI3]MDI1460752.1 hypothetical protein [Catellatospora sp. KI3]
MRPADLVITEGSPLDHGTRALWTEGDLWRSRIHFELAYRQAEQAGDPQAQALAALGQAGLWVHEHRGAAAAAAVEARLARALSTLDPRSPLALRIRLRQTAEADYRRGRTADILAALAEAERSGDPVVLTEAISLAYHCLLGPDHGPQRRELSRRILAAAVDAGCRSDLVMGMLWQTAGRFLDADPHAERSLTELKQLLAEQDHLAVSFVVQAVDVMLLIRAGRFADAETLATACAHRGRQAGDADSSGWYGAHLFALRWYQGRTDELLPMLEEMVNSPTLSATDNSFLAAWALARARAGDHRQATAALARLTGPDLACLPRSSSWLVCLYGVVETACLLGDPATAAAAYNLLAPYGHLPMLASVGISCFGSVQQALGVAALTTGEPDRAVRHLRAAVHDNLVLGHFPAATTSRARLAEALRLRAAPGDRAQADTEHHLADREAADLGMSLPAGVFRPAPGRAVKRPALCRRQGASWEIELGHRTATVDDSVGMGYLAALLANPGFEIPAVDLAVGPGRPVPTTDVAQPVLDDAAKQAYRRKLAELQDELDSAEAANDLARAERTRAEKDWLIAELAAATGLHGRVRSFTGSGERARVAVGKAIRRALDRIAAADPVIGEELRAAVRTGVRCSYRPS